MRSKDADWMANSVDPDQTAPSVWSGSTLFPQTCLSEKLGSLKNQSFILYFQKSEPDQ